MKIIMNNKTYSAYIETVGGQIRRTDKEGSVVENVFNMLAQAVRSSDPGDEIYVSRFLYKTLESKSYDYWLGGTFKSGVALTDKEMDAVINFTMLAGSGVVFKNIDKYTLNDIEDMNPELAAVFSEVVSARIGWKENQVVVEEKDMIAPVTAEIKTSQDVVAMVQGININVPNNKEEKIMDNEVRISIVNMVEDAKKKPVSVGTFGGKMPVNKELEALYSNPVEIRVEPVKEEKPVAKVEPVVITVDPVVSHPKNDTSITINLDDTPVIKSDTAVTIELDDKPSKKTPPKSKTVEIILEGDKLPSFFEDPYAELMPSADYPSGIASPRSSSSSAVVVPVGLAVNFVTSAPKEKTNASSPVSQSILDMVLARKSRKG